MCGILAAFGTAPAIAQRLQRLSHRGPDETRVTNFGPHTLGFVRLAVATDTPATGIQPFRDAAGRGACVNGEIYNHAELGSREVDCDVVLPLFEKHGPEFVNMLEGMFAIIIWDKPNNKVFIARDHCGIIPLYWACSNDSMWVASEMKALPAHSNIQIFPPRHYYYGPYDAPDKEVARWYPSEWLQAPVADPHAALRETLERACVSHVDCPTRFGFLLSGGLDSSLVLAICADAVRRAGKELHTFTIGLEDSPDLDYARRVAEAFDTHHHEVKYTVEEGIAAVSSCIYHIETFDVTTVRASVPQFLLASYIRDNGFKMVMSGEGSDELLGGYLYFRYSPDAQQLHEECVRKFGTLHMYDCLRTNKTLAAFGVETRVPFLDRGFVQAALTMPAELKMHGADHVEKRVLREAFDGRTALPADVLWRQKAQFSDSVGSRWIGGLQAEARARGFATEQAWYETEFIRHYQGASAMATVPRCETVACSSGVGASWVPENVTRDPSAAQLAAVNAANPTDGADTD